MDKNTITVAQLLDQIASEFCDSYCKYPEVAASERSDTDDTDYLYDHYCGDCPLQRLM